MIQEKFYNQFLFVMFASLLLGVTGCGIDDYTSLTDMNADSDEYLQVNVIFNGVETLFGPYGDDGRNVQYNKIHETRDYDKTRMFETLVMAEPDTLCHPLTRSTSSMTNTTFRVVVYDEYNAIYKGTAVFDIDAVGTVVPRDSEKLMLKSGKYYFHYFSPSQIVNVKENNVTVSLPSAGGTTDPAFYYAKTETAVQLIRDATGKGVLSVPVLQPKYCKLSLDVSRTKDETVTYTNAILSTTFNTSASLSLPSGTVTSGSPASSTTIAFNSPTIYVYPGHTGSFKMTINSVYIDGVSKGNITTATNTTGMTLAAGNAYKASVKILPKNYIKIGALPYKVARGVLLYNSTTGKWYMAPDQGYYSIAESGGYETLSVDGTIYGNKGDKIFGYFAWGIRAKNPNNSTTSSGPYADTYGGTTSGTYYGSKFGYNSKSTTSASTSVSNYKNNNDPCYAALGGNWHLPTGSSNGDVGYLGRISRTSTYQPYITRSTLANSSARTVQGFYFGTTTKPANQDQYVFFPVLGERASSGKMNRVGVDGNYWTSSLYSGNTFPYSLRIHDGTNVDPDSYGTAYTGFALRCITF